MRALLIFVVAAAFVIFESESLECYSCVNPAKCLHLRKGETEKVTCKSGQVCQRTSRKAYDSDNKPEPGDDFKTVGGAVWERLCNDKAKCDAKSKSTLKTTTCCSTDLCNK